ncbi:MAG: hypothetical protein ACOYEV_05050 [Candidatus Nanopelagicales bacterium]
MNERLAPGERLRLERTGQAMSQEELGGQAFRASYVSRVEAGQRGGSERFWDYAAGRLGVTSQFLLTGAANDEFELTDGVAAAAAGEIQRAREILSGLIAPGSARRHVRAAALDCLIDLSEQAGEAGQALDLLAARANLGYASPLDEVRGAWRLTEGLLASGDLHQAADVAREQLGRAETAGVANTLPGIRLRTSYARGLRLRGDLHSASEQIRLAVDDAAAAEDLAARAGVLWQAARIAAERQQFEHATHLATHARDLLVANGDGVTVSRVRIAAAEIALAGETPDLTSLEAELGAALSAAAAAGDTPALGSVHLLLARIRVAEGRFAEAAEEADLAQDTFGSELPAQFARAATVRAQIAGRAGDAARAGQEAATAFDLLNRCRSGACEPSWEELAAVFEELGDLPAALECYRALAARRRH